MSVKFLAYGNNDLPLTWFEAALLAVLLLLSLCSNYRLYFQAYCGIYADGEGSLASIESESEQLFLEKELKTNYRTFFS
jgi:hypothetical protein